MKRFTFKKTLLCAAVLAVSVSAVGCGDMSLEFPGIDSSALENNTENSHKVNLYFQNNENTYLINHKGKTSIGFFESLSKTIELESDSNERSRTYILRNNGNSLVLSAYDREENGNKTWDVAVKENSPENAGKNIFYEFDSADLGKRQENGIVSLFLDEVKKADIAKAEEETAVSPPESNAETSAANQSENDSNQLFDPEAINIIFTDLSEKNISDLGKDFYNYYLINPEYSACVLAVNLETTEGETLYFDGKDRDGIASRKSKDTKYYYLVMTGPSSELANFVQTLTEELENADHNFTQGGTDKSYRISDLYFTPDKFDQNSDAAYNLLSDVNSSEISNNDDAAETSGSSESETEQNVVSENDVYFENCPVRLTRIEGSDSVFSAESGLRENIIEFRYDAKENVVSENNTKLKGYRGGKTKDFSFSTSLNKSVSNRGLVDNKTDLSYVFGVPEIYYQNDNVWTVMDKDHKERFFKDISITDKSTYSDKVHIIGDYSDECGIHEIYVTIPVYQKAVVDNVLSAEDSCNCSWVINECTYNGTNTDDEVKKTSNFNYFYMNLFNMSEEGSVDEDNADIEEKKDVFSQVGEMHILIEDIH